MSSAPSTTRSGDAFINDFTGTIVFVNQHHLQFLLRPEHYSSEEFLQRERQLFLNSWQFVCSKSELKNDGDFLTFELLGIPVIVRNFGGRLSAFQNVCSHRHSRLTALKTGNSPTLRCQYHGWEYDCHGKTAKIPDARCFRPWDRENSSLVRYRIEECGDLLFVALSDSVPSLSDWLSPNFEELQRDFSSPEWQMRWVWEYETEANWKVPLENTVESYHVQAVHQKFYGDFYPSEQKSEHVLDPRYTQLTYFSDTRMEAWQARLRNWLGGTASNVYVHRHYHPNTVLVTTDTMNYALMVIPQTARKSLVRMRAYGVVGTRRDPFSRMASWYAWRLGKKSTLQVHNEDRAIYPQQQLGLEASQQKGVIGTREERIYEFQKYVLKTLGDPMPKQKPSE